MIKNGEIIMCQDDVAQLPQSGQGSKAAGRPVSCRRRSLGHRLYTHPGVSFNSWARTLGKMETDLKEGKVLGWMFRDQTPEGLED